ncbi:hypothetical protein EB796_011569 [Bugula neritina]|uniref:Uncharacterized protein n=1 Tax=Bugula neritina TaxID=10212 RepID=A0A7J7JUS4_BUGNE|nr:hypothetical protein EB796_011569 [Bugula neritina]
MMEGITEKITPYGSYMQIRISAMFTSHLLKSLSLLPDEVREKVIYSSAEYMSTHNPDTLRWLAETPWVSGIVPELLSGLILLSEVGQKAVARDTVLMVDAESSKCCGFVSPCKYIYGNCITASTKMSSCLHNMLVVSCTL